jgi:hypothetical protein
VQDGPPRLRHKRSSAGIRDLKLSQMQSHPQPDLSTASYNNPSPLVPEPQPAAAEKMVPKPKRRKSGLRGVFRRMFSRRGKEELKRESGVPLQRHGYHRSVGLRHMPLGGMECRLTASLGPGNLECCAEQIQRGHSQSTQQKQSRRPPRPTHLRHPRPRTPASQPPRLASPLPHERQRPPGNKPNP